MLRHIVLLQFKETLGKPQREQILTAFADLKNQINEVQHIEVGANHSPEDLNKNFTHAVIVTFQNAQSRDAYLIHPAHQSFVQLLKPSLADVLVIDFDI